MSAVVETPRDDVSLVAMLNFVRRHLGVIALCVLGSTVAAIILAFSLKPMYRAEVIAFPAESGNGMSALGNQLGGLASLAGVNLGAGGGKKSDEALEFLRSRAFTSEFIQRHGLMPILFTKKWDAARNQWRDPDDVPTISEGVARFSKKVRQVAEDKRTGMVTLSIIWSDRVLAAQWANALIAEADKALRERAIAEQARSIEYLKAEAAQTSTVEIGNAISKLMESELKNSMLARTRDAYAFKVLDPAVVRDPKDRDSPNKPLIAALGVGFGLLVGVILGAIRQSRHRQSSA
jgi:uncharacterized protein involved in exopolysaccharide biosynthesis